MNLDTLRESIYKYIGEKHKFKVKGVRGSDSIIYGTITKCYPYIFIIEDDSMNIYSFSYSDYLISNISIIDVK